jgi:RNA polymerase sigma-70 factor (ECF subfamily)
MAPADPLAALSLRDLDRALARITEHQRQVILLIGLDDFSYAQAAAILEVPTGTIRPRLSRGRASLRTLLDGREGTEAAKGASITGTADLTTPASVPIQ